MRNHRIVLIGLIVWNALYGDNPFTNYAAANGASSPLSQGSRAETAVETPTLLPSPTPVKTVFPINTPAPQSPITIFTLGTPGGEDDPGIIHACAFLPGGLHVLTSDYKNRVIKWSRETAQPVLTMTGVSDFQDKLILSKDGSQVMRGGQNSINGFGTGYKTYLWNTGTGALIHEKQWHDIFRAWDLFDNGKRLLFSTYREGMWLWDIESDQQTGGYKDATTYPIFELKISPDESRFAYIPSDEFDGLRVVVREIESGAVQRVFDLKPKNPERIQWSSDGRYIWITSLTRISGRFDKKYLDLFDAGTGEQVYHYATDQVSSEFVISPGGGRLAVISSRDVLLQDLVTLNVLTTMPHKGFVTTAAFSPDGSFLLTGTNNSSTFTAEARLWDISAFPDPGLPLLPAFTPTPTPTVTPTPTPVMPRSIAENSAIIPHLRYQGQSAGNSPAAAGFVEDPQNGDFYMVIFEEIRDKEYFKDYSRYLSVYRVGLPGYPVDLASTGMELLHRFSVEEHSSIGDIDISSDGEIAVLTSRRLYIIENNGTMRHWNQPGNPPFAVRYIPKNANIEGAGPGGLLLLQQNEVVLVHPADQGDTRSILIPREKIPSNMKISDIAIGPEGKCYLLLNGGAYSHDKLAAVYGPRKIMVWTDQSELREWSHISFNGYVSDLTYSPVDDAFYLLLNDVEGETGHNAVIRRYRNPQANSSAIAGSNDVLLNFFFSSSRNSLFISSFLEHTNFLSEMPVQPLSALSPTPDVMIPSPTPTPVAGWLVLDGFGGIHSTKAGWQRPVLPYFVGNNIVRDLEPDPLGEGWYMLDGYGGIHTDPYNLPKPDSLPYFGFDNARNLEVKMNGGMRQFYMLDGFGVIHSSEPDAPRIKSPVFSGDVMRDLEPVPNSDDWMVLDMFGTIYIGGNGEHDIIRYAAPYSISPVMRGVVRFPDQTTVMIDHFGGRHTNDYFPAQNVVDGLPDNFYFPGFPIIWDIELIPPSFNE